MLRYVDVNYKSAADLYKRLSKLGDEFVQHTGKLDADDVFTLELVTRKSERDKIAARFGAVLSLDAETNQILTMKIDTLKRLLRETFPTITIIDIIKLVKNLPV